MNGKWSLRTINDLEPPGTSQAHWAGKALLLAQGICLAGFAVVLVIFIASIPAYVAYLHTLRAGGVDLFAGQLTVDGLQRLQALGLSLNAYIAYLVGVKVLFVSVWLLVGAVVFWRKADDPMALFVSFTLVTFSVSFGFWAQAVLPQWGALLVGLNALSGLCISFLLPVFPDGRFVPRWSRWPVIIGTLYHQGLSTLLPGVLASSPLLSGLDMILFMGGTLFVIGVQVYRYRRVSTQAMRQQTKWAVFGFAAAMAGFAVALFLGTNYTSALAPGTPSYMFQHTLVFLSLLFIPVSIGMAILRSHLWDIDIIVNRTVVYGLLTVCIIALYVLVVGYLGALFRTELNLLISLIAAGLVAVVFQPLRRILQRGVNRLFYGLRDEPYMILAGLSQRLKASLDPEAVLPIIVQSVREALKLSYAAIEVNEGAGFTLAAASGTPPASEPARLPLVYQGQPVGALLIGPRGQSDALTPADLRLLENLADQIGVATRAVRLTADLKRMAADLQLSRERLVVAREEERRRLRRDLHDGVGPTLASLSQRIDTACRLVKSDPDAAIELLEYLKGQVKSTLADIRRLAYALRPPILDELGLVPAIQQQVVPLQEANGLRISVEAPVEMPELTAAVEVTTYRIALEALANVARHAQAKVCRIRLELAGEDSLCLSVSDDGRGLPADYHAGVGITSMRERVSELGGAFTLTSSPDAGTRLQVRLPMKS